jgi:hypothetical protein
LIRRELIRRV